MMIYANFRKNYSGIKFNFVQLCLFLGLLSASSEYNSSIPTLM